MVSETAVAPPPPLAPLPYHEAMRDFLKSQEQDVWNWFASQKARGEQAEAVRFDLLKSTYRLQSETDADLYAAAEEVARRLALEVPITIYQAQNPAGLNASLAYIPGEAHIVLHGPVAKRLNDVELRALLAHELSHLLLWEGWQGEFFIVDQILAALTHDSRAQPSHFASARLFGLYNEIFCDRGSLYVVERPLDVVSMLVKVQTGVETVSAESYLRQAEEIFSTGPTRSDEVTHPEAFIRARSIKLFHDQGAEANPQVVAMIEGSPVLDELDLLAQCRVADTTRRLVDVFLAPAWMQTEATLAHARLFFDEYAAPAAGHVDEALPAAITECDRDLKDYFCYVLLDFVTSDRDLEELPLAAALLLVERCEIKSPFVEIARKEMRLRKRQFEKLDAAKHELLAKAQPSRKPESP